MSRVLVDAGPLVALLDGDDPHHDACVRALQAIREPMVSVWPAITEVAHLVRRHPLARRALLDWIKVGAVEIAPLGRADLARIAELMDKYADLPMDLADAALVRVAERDGLRVVFTIDRRDFSTYRAKGLGKLTLLP